MKIVYALLQRYIWTLFNDFVSNYLAKLCKNWSIIDIQYSFHVYNIMIWHLYELWTDHHNKLSVTRQGCYNIDCFASLWLTYFTTGSLNLFTPFTYFMPAPFQTPSTLCNHHCVLCVCECGFCFVLFHLLFFLLWLSSLLICSMSIYVVTNGKISLFLMAE